MTILAELSRTVTLQCDVCLPPVITTNSLVVLRRTGWDLRIDGSPVDTCPRCAMTVGRPRRRGRADTPPTDPDPELLPNLFVIGAMKAGTTSMHAYLDRHPQVLGSSDKELRFFADPNCRDWVGRYQAYFNPGTRYRLESSPVYSKAPTIPGVAARMAELVPQAKLLYLVRDPIERVIADYVEKRHWGATSAPLEDELVDADDPGNQWVAPSRYATQLQEFLDHFAADQIQVIDQANLAADATTVVSGVFTSLGLEPIDLTMGMERHNTGDSKGSVPSWVHLLRRGRVGRLVHRVPQGPRQVIGRALRRQQAERPILSPATQKRLRELLSPEVDKLRDLTGHSFDTWTV
jgi:hypothetical protein